MTVTFTIVDEISYQQSSKVKGKMEENPQNLEERSRILKEIMNVWDMKVQA